MSKRDYYEILGVDQRRRWPAAEVGVSQAGAPIPSGSKPQRPRRRREVQRGVGSLRGPFGPGQTRSLRTIRTRRRRRRGSRRLLGLRSFHLRRLLRPLRSVLRIRAGRAADLARWPEATSCIGWIFPSATRPSVSKRRSRSRGWSAAKSAAGRAPRRDRGPKTCPDCGGHGRQRFSQGFFTVTRPCPACGGEGKVIDKKCRACQGEGRGRATRKLEIRIPAGVETGSRSATGGRGRRGSRGRAFRRSLRRDHRARRRDSFGAKATTSCCRLDLPYPTLVLGGEVTIPTLEGRTRRRSAIAAGTQPGSEVRLRGRGFGRLGRQKPGRPRRARQRRRPRVSFGSKRRSSCGSMRELVGAPTKQAERRGKSKEDLQ